MPHLHPILLASRSKHFESLSRDFIERYSLRLTHGA